MRKAHAKIEGGAQPHVRLDAEQVGHAAAARPDGADGVRLVEVEVGRVLLLERDDLAQPAELTWLGPGIGIGLGIGFGFGFG